MKTTLSYILPFLSFIVTLTLANGQVDIQADSSNFQGKLTIDNTLENNGMRYPLGDGYPGQVLNTDGQGNLGWTYAGSFLNYVYTECSAQNEIIMGAQNYSFDTCGVLYDSGGEIGNYSNNEDLFFGIGSFNTALYTRVILHELDVEVNRDTLWIEDNVYTGSILEPDTLIFSGNTIVNVNFHSDNINTDAGFKISWERLFYNDDLGPVPFAGFYFDPVKTSVGGGVEIDDAWVESGFRSVFFGFGAKALGQDNISIGTNVIAAQTSAISIGHFSSVSGSRSLALGYSNKVNGADATAVGVSNSILSKSNTTAIGYKNIVDGNKATAMGYDNDALAEGATAIGHKSIASALASTAIGWSSTASATSSTAVGSISSAFGANSSSFGYSNSANGSKSSSLGYDNSSPGIESSALGYKNISTGEGGVAIGHSNDVTLEYGVAMGYNNTSGQYSSAVGRDNSAFLFSSAMGRTNSASGFTSAASGVGNIASSEGASAFGTSNIASGIDCGAFGYNNDSEVEGAYTFGNGLLSDVYQMTVIGRFNDPIPGSASAYIGTDPSFVVGIGNTNLSKENGLVILKNGDVGIGTNDPEYKLRVNGKVSCNQLRTVGLNGVIHIGANFNLTNTTNMITDNSETPSIADGDEDLYIQDDLELAGNGFKPGGGDWLTVSDRRLKKDIVPYEDGLQTVLDINPIWYNYNDRIYEHDKKRHIGVLAQEIGVVAPYMVEERPLFMKKQENEDGEEIIIDEGELFYTYDGTALKYMLVNAIKEQQEIIERQDESIKNLEIVLETLQTKVNMLAKELAKRD